MKVKILSMLMCFLTVICCLGQEKKFIPESKSGGKVKGILFDWSFEAVIPNLKIVIEGQGIKQAVTTGDSGEYEFNLPAGIYNITIEQKRHYEWLYPLKRGKVEIRPKITSVVNIYPSTMGKIIALVATYAGMRDEVTITNKPPKYESISTASTSSFDLVIQFNKKRIRKTIAEYEDVTLTCNNITIIAQKISYNRNKQQIKAEGLSEKILIDNNGQRYRASELNIELKNGLAIIH